ncbi:hypothetical protein B7494_g3119 [Chlorociboria aeruginascens]|nr:hypothetical protein B7494_g3119 [Chlorociboria aeruginascens]
MGDISTSPPFAHPGPKFTIESLWRTQTPLIEYPQLYITPLGPQLFKAHLRIALLGSCNDPRIVIEADAVAEPNPQGSADKSIDLAYEAILPKLLSRLKEEKPAEMVLWENTEQQVLREWVVERAMKVADRMKRDLEANRKMTLERIEKLRGLLDQADEQLKNGEYDEVKNGGEGWEGAE